MTDDPQRHHLYFVPIKIYDVPKSDEFTRTVADDVRGTNMWSPIKGGGTELNVASAKSNTV